MNSSKRDLLLKSKLTISCIILIGLLGSAMVAYSTRWGPWVFSDSTGYIVSARNLIAGHGLGLFGASGEFHPLTLHPPFYSLSLAFFGWLGADLLSAARWLNVFLFGLTIIVLGLSIYSATHSSWLSIITGFLVLSMPDLIDVHSGAMSEPLFIFTGLLSVSLVLWFIKNHHWLILIAASIVVGLSIITRYAGFAFMAAGLVALFFFSTRTWKYRIVDALLFGVIGILPVIAWQVWLNTQPVDDHLIQSTVNFGEQLTNFRLNVMEIFWSWLPFTSLLPRYSYDLAKIYFLVAGLIVLLFTSLALWKLRRNKQAITHPSLGLSLAAPMLVFSVAYLIILAFSYIYTLPTPDLINRTLLPVHIAFLVGLFLLGFFMIKSFPSMRWLSLVPVILAIGIFVSYMHDELELVSQYHENGAGYTSRVWRQSGTIRSIEQLSADIPLISNEPAAVYFYTNRPAYDILELVGDEPKVFAAFGDDPNDPAQLEFRENRAALVLFNSSLWQFKRIYYDQAPQRMEAFTRGLYLYAQAEDGSIYLYSPPEH